jgi:hypothetical protein
MPCFTNQGITLKGDASEISTRSTFIFTAKEKELCLFEKAMVFAGFD